MWNRMPLLQGNKSLKMKGTGEQRQFWGTGNIHRKLRFSWGNRGNADLCQGSKVTALTVTHHHLGGSQDYLEFFFTHVRKTKDHI